MNNQVLLVVAGGCVDLLAAETELVVGQLQLQARVRLYHKVAILQTLIRHAEIVRLGDVGLGNDNGQPMFLEYSLEVAYITHHNFQQARRPQHSDIAVSIGALVKDCHNVLLLIIGNLLESSTLAEGILVLVKLDILECMREASDVGSGEGLN